MKAAIELGKKMMVECPENDCLIYRNTYKMYRDITDDLNGCLLSEYSKSLLTHKQEKLLLDLEQMYLTNYAVCQYRRAHK